MLQSSVYVQYISYRLNVNKSILCNCTDQWSTLHQYGGHLLSAASVYLVLVDVTHVQQERIILMITVLLADMFILYVVCTY